MKKRKKILIVGAGTAGRQLARELKKPPQTFWLVGFVDDSVKIGKKINKASVLGKIGALKRLARQHKVDEIFIAIPSADGQTIRRVLEATKGLRLKFKIVPRTLEIVRGKVNLQQLRELEITDLLGRAIIKSEQAIFEKEFAGKKILVTGAAGSIGSELCRQLVQFSPKTLVAFDWSENGLFELNMEITGKGFKIFKCSLGSVQDIDCLRDVVNKFHPHYIFHAAAFKHIPLTQENPLEAIKNNVFGTINITEVAKEYSVDKFIYISSDKAADPVSIMGATKLVGEQIVSAANKKGKTKFATVRFGNVLESSGSVIPIFRKQIAGGGPVTVTNSKMTRFFMSIPEAVQLVLQSCVLEKGGEIFILEMGEQVKIDDLAHAMIQLAGFIPDKDIPIEYIGTRPGEKLEEKLYGENESITGLVGNGTRKIFKIYNKEKMDDGIVSLLRNTTQEGNVKKALTLLKSVSPKLLIN